MSTTIPASGTTPVAASVPRPSAGALKLDHKPQSQPETAAAQSRSNTAVQSRNSQKELDDLVQRLNSHFSQTGRNLNFSVDEKSERTVITVKDSSTGEVIRQIPDMALLEVGHDIEKIKGMLLNKEI